MHVEGSIQPKFNPTFLKLRRIWITIVNCTMLALTMYWTYVLKRIRLSTES